MLFPIVAFTLGLLIYLQIGRALGGLRWDLWNQKSPSGFLSWFCFPLHALFEKENDPFCIDEFKTRKGYQMFMAFSWPATIGWTLTFGSLVLFFAVVVLAGWCALKVLQKPVEILIFGPPKLYQRIREAKKIKPRQAVLPPSKAVSGADALSEIARLKQAREDIDTRIMELTTADDAVREVEHIAPAS